MQRSPTKSHVVPARLLAQFARPRKDARSPKDLRTWELTAYSRGTAPQARSIATSYEKRFYRFTGDDGKANDDLESWMAEKVEGPFNDLLSQFDSPLYVRQHSHSQIINRYISTTFCRSQQRRTASHVQQQKVMNLVSQIVDDPAMLRQLGAAFSFVLQKSMRLEDIREATLAMRSQDSFEARNSQYLRNFRKYDEDLYQLLSGREYGFLRSRNVEFILGDTVLLTREIHNGLLIVGAGFAKPNMHVLLPISPKTCIQVGIAGLGDRFLLEHEVESINQDQVKLMHRYVYSQTPNEKTQKMVDEFGGSLNYTLNAFVTPDPTPVGMLDSLIQDILSDMPFRLNRSKRIG